MLNYFLIFSLFLGCNGVGSVGSGESVKIVKLTTSLTYVSSSGYRPAAAVAVIEDVPDGVIDYTCYCVMNSKNAKKHDVDENGYYYDGLDNWIGAHAGKVDVQRNINTGKLRLVFECSDKRVHGVETTPTCILQY